MITAATVVLVVYDSIYESPVDLSSAQGLMLSVTSPTCVRLLS